MRIILTVIAFLILSKFHATGQSVKQRDSEKVDSFINRLRSDTLQLAHPIIEAKVWGKKSIVAFYGYDDPRDTNEGFNKIYGHLYMLLGQKNYRDIVFGPIEEDGGYPEIISIFFANADNDSAKELIVICKYVQRHYDYNGDFFESFIFDNPGEQGSLTFLEELSEKFWGCECDWRDGRKELAKFKTSKEVRIGLVKLGYH